MVGQLNGSTRSGRHPSVLVLAFVLVPALAALALHATARLARAQNIQRVITGTILDVRDNPVPFVAITVNGGATAATAMATAMATATTDDSGRFRLVVPHRERVVFDARRVGFMPSRIALVAGGDTTISMLLLPAATNLPKVEVKDAPLRPVGLAGFERRMIERKHGAGAGWFITAKDIGASNPTRATQVVEAVPSINVRRVSGDRFAIYGRSSLGQDCPATVYLDGIVIGGVSDLATARDRRGRTIIVKAAEGAPIDMLLEPSEIAGVEVYQRGIFAPNQLQPTDPNAMRCAIVAYWTKHGG
jgi:hypothetical protein